jgi:hypothetical protein
MRLDDTNDDDDSLSIDWVFNSASNFFFSQNWQNIAISLQTIRLYSDIVLQLFCSSVPTNGHLFSLVYSYVFVRLPRSLPQLALSLRFRNLL